MTLTTTEVGADALQFCINASAPNSANDQSSTFGVSWTDGFEYSAENYAVDGVTFTVYAGTTSVYDVGSIDTTIDENNDWTLISDNRTCDDAGTCVFDFCASRPLQAGDSNDYDLPIKKGSSVIATFSAGDFSGTVHRGEMGALSLGFAILTAAGAALALI